MNSQGSNKHDRQDSDNRSTTTSTSTAHSLLAASSSPGDFIWRPPTNPTLDEYSASALAITKAAASLLLAQLEANHQHNHAQDSYKNSAPSSSNNELSHLKPPLAASSSKPNETYELGPEEEESESDSESQEAGCGYDFANDSQVEIEVEICEQEQEQDEAQNYCQKDDTSTARAKPGRRVQHNLVQDNIDGDDDDADIDIDIDIESNQGTTSRNQKATHNKLNSSNASNKASTNRDNQQRQPTTTGSRAMPKQRRLYKCRHCGFETDKKVENWQHIRIHMRPEKLLACESCQFVTEYKHHLEYHQRNHSGYKPFKCDNCDYQCVNKSMLNSHKKSHSTYYQYQCGDCKYATKYVHSLKMHLRKYNHQPTQLMIDVYGRKRGPKSTSSSSPSSQTQSGEQQQCILDLRVDSKLIS